MNLRLACALIVFGVDLWALSRMLGRIQGRRARLKWTAVIVGLPLAGAVMWWKREKLAAGQ